MAAKNSGLDQQIAEALSKLHGQKAKTIAEKEKEQQLMAEVKSLKAQKRSKK